ncbi:uncharacterized membrane protein YhaH (DUF805 family) [Natronocella acetinitrilica]|uniref:Uncharacterized membrane protein YhaH (DUF805 family) n=1 Tax=Natronocella acetinitrilica TaxID=414046 RepID=A0AAE3G3H6_9GAMM|nr:DUF805 domain-containing protein [Natronocella acetinitrilica]MCP1674498.1 uncharacterized membrane protein YhaH (DUF805 family) [Natronocella acetinitrilica]
MRAILRHFARAWDRDELLVGRASWAEYWSFQFVSACLSVAISIILVLLDGAFGLSPLAGYAVSIVWLMVIVPPLVGVGVRRLHDIGLSGWWHLVALIPFVGPPLTLLVMLLPGRRGANRYGESPRAAPADGG